MQKRIPPFDDSRTSSLNKKENNAKGTEHYSPSPAIQPLAASGQGTSQSRRRVETDKISNNTISGGQSASNRVRNSRDAGPGRTRTQKPVAQKSGLSVEILPKTLVAYLRYGEGQRWTARTLGNRKERLGKLVWFVQNWQDENGNPYTICDADTIADFRHYLNHGHEYPGGRWGNPLGTKPISSETAKSYYASLRAFFQWCIEEERIPLSPMVKMKPPVSRPDQVQPYTHEQLSALFDAASRSFHPRRDRAILALLVDTGLRASELTNLLTKDVDIDSFVVTVEEGKGGKRRTVPFCSETRKAIYEYLKERDYEPMENLFLSDRGVGAGGGLTPQGLGALFKRLGRAANLDNTRVNPHRMRHTFAVEYLRRTGDALKLRMLLGHESLAMTTRYVALASGDLANAHLVASPMAGLVADGVIATGGRKHKKK